MKHIPDFSELGYQVIRELGRNREGGRTTYLARAVNENQQVVLKEYRFAGTGASPTAFQAYQRQIQLLQQLDHPRIPRYLDSFETAEGFCLVQEYKNSPSAAQGRSFTPEEIKQIAVSILEILVYLQNSIPRVIHQDIKPENILVDQSPHKNHLCAYLVDFGLAANGGSEVAHTIVTAGTPGFMPPEKLFNRPLTEASDLYSLGATLICLLTRTSSVDIGNIINDNYRFNFQSKVPQLSHRFISWLEKMVSFSVRDRFDNAANALEALKPIRVKGGGTPLEILRMPGSLLRLASLSIVTLLSANFITSCQGIPVRKLLQTKSCVQCNLREADMEGANLENANLQSAEMMDAKLQNADMEGANLLGANLQNADLMRVKLVEANLQGANLEGANLQDANLQKAKLEGAKLNRANLEGAKLDGANLTGAELKDANLEGAKLKGAKLEDANLRNVNLEGAELGGASLKDAKLKDAELAGAKLEGAKLGGAKLEDANLEGADLENANLEGASLEDANLEGAKLEGANFEGANLKGAKLRNANLQGANLKNAKLEGANLQRANLKDAKLEVANLGGANLEDAKLEGANLKGANLDGANLDGVNLKNAIKPDGTKEEPKSDGASLKDAVKPDAPKEDSKSEGPNLNRPIKAKGKKPR